MRIPYKFSTTTSNFMIGRDGRRQRRRLYHRGYIDPGLTMPVVLGELAG
jgi:uncharacterized protein